MPRKTVKPEPNVMSRGAFRAWPPECYQCRTKDEPGWTGEPNDQQSPYIACFGDVPGTSGSRSVRRHDPQTRRPVPPRGAVRPRRGVPPWRPAGPATGWSSR